MKMKTKKIVPRKPKRSAPVSHADYWLGTSIEEMDISQLASVQRAITNFTRIIAKKSIPTAYSAGKDSYTDGKSIVLSAPRSLKDIDSTVGLALHEASHILYTDFDQSMIGAAVVQLRSNHTNSPVHSQITYARLKALVNIIEDRRIDRLVCDSAPGYVGYYKSLYDRYFNAKEIDEALRNGQLNDPTFDNYEFHINNCVNPYFNPDVLPGLEEMMQCIDLPNITRLSTTKDVVYVAATVLELIIQNVEANWVEPEVMDDQPNTMPPTSKPSVQDDEVQDDEENLDLPSSSSQSESNEVQDDDEDSGQGDGAGSTGESDIEGEDEDDPSSEDSISTQGTPQADAKEAKAAAKLEKAIQAQKDFLEGNIKKNKVSRDSARVLANMARGVIEEVEVSVKDWNQFTRKVKCVIVKGLEAAGEIHGMSRHISKSKWHCDKMRPIIQQAVQIGHQLGNRLKTRTESHSLATTRQAKGKIDRRLLAELGFDNERVFTQTIFDEVQPAHIHVSIDASGSMDGRKFESAIRTAVAVAKAASMIDDVTCMITMRGSFIDSAKRGIESACMFIVYDSTKDRLNAAFLEKLCWLDCNAATPEALCYDAAATLIERQGKGRDTHLINISDGEPSWSAGTFNYAGPVAVDHTKSVLNKLRASNINILSYFVYDSEYEMTRSKPMFEAMYGKSASFIDVSSLAQLGQSINKLLEYTQK